MRFVFPELTRVFSGKVCIRPPFLLKLKLCFRFDISYSAYSAAPLSFPVAGYKEQKYYTYYND
jgi:hypothetical protein